MTIPFTSSTGTAPLAVTTNNSYVTYATLINMLGQMVWEVEVLYFRPQNMNQFANQPAYTNYNMFGNNAARMLITVPDTWQYNTSLFLYLPDQKIIFDGSATLSFNLMPREQMQLYPVGDQTRILNAFAPDHTDNFESIEDKMGRPHFFKDYTDIL
jgi:hypothetical protein